MTNISDNKHLEIALSYNTYVDANSPEIWECWMNGTEDE